MKIIYPTNFADDKLLANTVITLSASHEVAIWFKDDQHLKRGIISNLERYGYCSVMNEDMERTFISIK